MSEQTPEPAGTSPGVPGGFTAEQYAAAAQEVAATGAPASPAAVQAATAQQMNERGPLLPAEKQIDDLMAALRAQSDQIAALQTQVGTMGKQMEEAQAAQGGPLAIRYAQGAVDKLAALDTSRPDHADGHFAVAHDLAATILDGAQGVVKGDTGLAESVKDAGTALERWITRSHSRAGGAHLDFSAILDDAELAVSEALKLAGV